jgi:HEAT repeat protein
MLAAATVAATLMSAAQSPDTRAWLILQEGLNSKRAAKRTNAVHSLRLLVHSPRAQELAERALIDRDPMVRVAAARALGPMGAVASVPKLKGLLTDKEPIVVLAAAHSLFLLGDREQVYDIDCAFAQRRKEECGRFRAIADQ